MFVFPEDLPLELTPFAFLVGKWEGTGIINYRPEGSETAVDREFSQRIEFAHDGHSVLTYISSAQLIGDGETKLPSELGYWRLARPAEPADHGPGFLLGDGQPSISTHEDLEKLRNESGGFNIQVSTLQPGGFSELYDGVIKGARIDLASYAGIAFEGARVYRHSTRMFGLVENALLWVWDIALPGSDLAPHASARLERVE